MIQVTPVVNKAAALDRNAFLREKPLLWSRNMARQRSLDGLRV